MVENAVSENVGQILYKKINKDFEGVDYIPNKWTRKLWPPQKGGSNICFKETNFKHSQNFRSYKEKKNELTFTKEKEKEKKKKRTNLLFKKTLHLTIFLFEE